MKFLILHSDPPTPCMHGLEKGLRDAGHAVVCVGTPTEYGDPGAFRRLDPVCRYLPATPNESIHHLTGRLGFFPDYVLFIRPNNLWLPTDLWECDAPTIAFLTEEWKDAEYDRHIAKYFDVCVYTNSPKARGVSPHPEPVWKTATFNISMMQWLTPSAPVTMERDIDLAFVGHFGEAGVTDERDRLLRELIPWCSEQQINFQIGRGLWLQELLNFYTRARIVLQHGGQGPSGFTYRIGEAMVSGAMVLAKRPVCTYGLSEPPQEGHEITYFDNDEDLRALLTYFLANPKDRNEMALAGYAYATSHNLSSEIKRFIHCVLESIPPDFEDYREVQERPDWLNGTRRGDIKATEKRDYDAWLYR